MDKYEFFKEKVYKLIGIDLSCYKEKQMKRRISSLITRNNFKDFDDYYMGLKDDNKLLDDFINYLTINVTEFYRNPTQWQVLEKDILPELLNNNRTLNIWSSACSTGEEPYSLIMLLSRFMPLDRINILATDIDENVMDKARLGIYSEKTLQNLPKEFVDKYFEKVSNSYQISELIKKRVKFRKLNLLSDDYPKDNDLIICRNVMIYFTEEAKNTMYKKFYDSLNNQGVLFVGSTEQIILPDRFRFKTAKTFFYKKNT